MTLSPSYEPPQFFLIKLNNEGVDYYVVCQSLISVCATSLPGGVKDAIKTEFLRASAGYPAEICELPNATADGSLGWLAMQAKIQVKPGPRP